MIGTRTPCLSSSSTTRGTAAAASSLLTVTRTSSDPARASAAHCWTVEGTSAVSVLVMYCTTIGASEPTRTPPTTTVTVFLRGIMAMGTSILARRKKASPLVAAREALAFGTQKDRPRTIPSQSHHLVPCMHYALSPKPLTPARSDQFHVRSGSQTRRRSPRRPERTFRR